MSSIPNTLKGSTIANMLATELKRRGITLSEDKANIILYGSAESLLYEDGIDRDIQLCVDKINEYINDTLKNYPKYFETGENN